jgi:hypothetical protein
MHQLLLRRTRVQHISEEQVLQTIATSFFNNKDISETFELHILAQQLKLQ